MNTCPLTIAGLAAAYRQPAGPAPADILDVVLSRIASTDDRVAAMVTVTEDVARAQAAAATRRIREGDPSPLAGVPVVLKDLIDVAGVPTTAGSRVLANNVATRDADVWQRLASAGAVLVGKANTHEFAYGGTTEPTRNPWALERMVGGSSGGPAAALAAGYCAAAIGTDTAGSVRIPAALCGVVGLKPSQRQWPAAGVIPLSPSLDVVGPLAHTPEDCALVAAVATASPSGFDEQVTKVTDRLRSRRLRIGIITNQGRTDPAIQRHVDAAIDALHAAGATCLEITIPELSEALAANFTILGAEAVLYHRRYESDRELYTPYVRQRLDEASTIPPEDLVAARQLAQRLQVAVDHALEDVDLLLGPGVPVPAPHAYVSQVVVDGQSEDRDSMFCRNYAFANLTGHPALSLPVGFVDGLPVAAQVVGSLGDDDGVLAFGAVLGTLVDWVPALATPY